MCTAKGKGSHYDIAQAGVWIDCVYERRPVIHNDYASLPHRKGMPDGHAPVVREVVVPIFRGKLIQAIIGVGNKSTDYNDSDIEIVSQLGDLSWDIVERKGAEEEIKRLASFPQFNPSPVLEIDPTGNIIYCNDATLRTLEKSGSEAGPVAYLPEDLAEIQAASREAGEEIFYREVRIKEKVFAETLHFLPALNVVRIYAMDITKRKRAEESLEKSAEEIHDLYNRAPCGYHSLNADGVFVQINDTELQWLGYTKDEIIGKKRFTDVISEQSLETFQENYPQFKVRGWVRDLEFEMVRKDGTILPVLLSASAMTDPDGNYIMSRSTVYDITERKQAEEELHRVLAGSEQRVRERTAELLLERQRLFSLLEGLPGVVTLLGPNYQFAFANHFFRERFGEPEGKHCYEILHGRTEPCESCPMPKVLAGNEVNDFEWTSPAGHVYQFSLYPFAEMDGATLMLELGTDITARKQAEGHGS